MLAEYFHKYQETIQVITDWMAQYGYSGGFLVSLGETVILPLIPDPFIVGAEALGLNAWLMVMFVVTGTFLGAIIGYFLGRWLGHPVVVKLFGEKTIAKGEVLINKYGVWAVIVAGFTPLPFKVMVWLAGIFEMPLGKYMVAVLIGRIPRFALMAILGGSIAKALG